MNTVNLTIITVCVFICSYTTIGKNIKNAMEIQDHKRIVRSPSKTNNEEFEKFFLKASKSVPRIGRRGSFQSENMRESVFNDINKMLYNKFPLAHQEKRFGKPYKVPIWTNIADIYEYNPELPNSPEILSLLDQPQNDDSNTYDWNKMRYKRNPVITPFQSETKELPEFRLQPNV